jgi:hypothetical protein
VTNIFILIAMNSLLVAEYMAFRKIIDAVCDARGYEYWWHSIERANAHRLLFGSIRSYRRVLLDYAIPPNA